MKVANRLMAIAFALLIGFFGILIYLTPKASFSEQENRSLAKFPDFNFRSIVNAEYSKGVSEFYTDHFPGRRVFTEIKCKTELLCGRRENNGVIYAEGGNLVIRPKYSGLSLYRQNLEQIERFCDKQSTNGINTTVFFAPRGIDVLGDLLGEGYPNGLEAEVWDTARSREFELLDATDKIRNSLREGEYVWFRTDHHWTADGAYKCYRVLCEALGEEARGEDLFFKESISSDFYGSVASKLGGDAPRADEIVLWRYHGDSELFVVNYDSKEVYSGLYRSEFAEKKDKYSVFLGGNYGHLGIYSESPNKREKLVVIKDSFANALIPFLAIHYDLEVYDLRYFKGKLSDEISDLSADNILLLYGIETVVTDGSFKYLNR